MSEHSEATEITDAEAQALEELADLMTSDPAAYERIVREGFQEAEGQEHGAALLDAIAGAQEHRQAEDRKLLGHLFGEAEAAE